MNDYEVLKELKICYEYMNDLLDNCDYINHEDEKTRNQLKNTMYILSDLYSNCYEMTASNKDSCKELKTDLDCPHCNKKVLISDPIDYAYVCENCDENLYLGEGDLNYEWYFNGKNKKANKSFFINLDYNKDTKKLIINSAESNEETYNCNYSKEIANSINSYIDNNIFGKGYFIQIWETEKDYKEHTPSSKIKSYFDDSKAIEAARDIFYENNYERVEISNLSDNKLIFSIDSKQETYYYDYKTISCVDSDLLDYYIYRWQKNKELPIDSSLLYCRDNDKFIAVDNTTNNCWVEEFESEQEAINWLKIDIKIDNTKGHEHDNEREVSI